MTEYDQLITALGAVVDDEVLIDFMDQADQSGDRVSYLEGKLRELSSIQKETRDCSDSQDDTSSEAEDALSNWGLTIQRNYRKTRVIKKRANPRSVESVIEETEHGWKVCRTRNGAELSMGVQCLWQRDPNVLSPFETREEAMVAALSAVDRMKSLEKEKQTPILHQIVRVPFSPGFDPGKQLTKKMQVHLDADESRKLASVLVSLRHMNAEVTEGNPVTSPAHAVRWLLRQISIP